MQSRKIPVMDFGKKDYPRKKFSLQEVNKRIFHTKVSRYGR
jgi:hypothetical protein